ncbi:MAG: LytR C-terminal domain-containing protein [Ilumatobacteraceae bacterium]
MGIGVGPSVDGGAPVLTFVPIDGAVTHSITALLTHGRSLTFESATSPVEIPVEPNIGVASVLVLGQDAAGVVIGATGGQFLIADDVAEPAPTAPPTTAADTTAPIVSAESTVPVDSALAAAMQVDGRVLVLNATTTGGIAGDLTARLRASGYDVAEPDNAAGGVRLAASIVYTQPDMPNSMLPTSIANVLDIGRWEAIGQQDMPALTPAMIESNDLIIVLGDDLAGAPWRARGLADRRWRRSAPHPRCDLDRSRAGDGRCCGGRTPGRWGRRRECGRLDRDVRGHDAHADRRTVGVDLRRGRTRRGRQASTPGRRHCSTGPCRPTSAQCWWSANPAELYSGTCARRPDHRSRTAA